MRHRRAWPADAALQAAAAVLTCALAVPALAGCSGAGPLQHRTRDYRVGAPVRALVVHGHVGGIKVTGGDIGEVAITERIGFRDTAPVTTRRVTGGILTLDSRCPGRDGCTVGYDIKLPKATAVSVSDNVGTITLRSLSGRVTAHTDVGDIDLASVSGPIGVTGHAGQIRGQDVSSPRAVVHMSAGRIDMTFSAAPATLTAASTAGSVTLRVPGGVSYRVHASSKIGSTRVTVPSSPSSPHVITATVTTGAVSVEPAPVSATG
jgi:putative adhesin